MIYFTSDLHIGHANILHICQRPFDNIQDMNETIIHNWNQRVQAKDTVYILGDFFFRMDVEDANAIIKKLKGKKISIKGNHDLKYDQSLFEEICDFKVVKYNRKKFILMHYPLLEWPHYFQGGIHLHGHQHNTQEYNLEMQKQGILRYDVGVDANNFKPISIDEIICFYEKSNEE